jgi:hypothetical protein
MKPLRALPGPLEESFPKCSKIDAFGARANFEICPP